ncbi:MAG: glucokinase [Actinomycetota bacterium]|jgi:glucokinase
MRKIGIDIGGTKMLGVVVESHDETHSVVDEVRVAAPVGGDIVPQIVAFVRSMGGAHTVGVGIAGLVRNDDVVVTTTHLPNVRGLELRGALESELGVPARVDNDATCAAVAEWRLGSARGIDEALVVTIGTGIGGGAIVGGRVVRGAHGFAGEFGHMVVVRDGESCPCGRRGCWECYASGRGISQSAGGIRAEDVLQRFVDGDEAARECVDSYAAWVALGLFDLTSAFDPSRIVLGGGLGARHEVLPLIDAHFRTTFAGHAGRDLPQIVNATLGYRAGAIGAAFVGAGD